MQNADLNKLLSSVLNSESAEKTRKKLENRFHEISEKEQEKDREPALTYLEQDELLWDFYHNGRKILQHLSEFEDSDIEIIQIMGEALAGYAAKEKSSRGL